MILHCYYCAFAGDRPSEASKVAVINNLHKPLRADMFSPLDPAHDPTPPFQSDEWRYMYHRACGRYPWPYDVDRIHGPNRVLTDKGFVELSQEATIPADSHTVTKPLPGAYLMDDPGDIMYQHPNTCDVCGKACKSPLGLNSHKRSHK
jgi:hypothetical protein